MEIRKIEQIDINDMAILEKAIFPDPWSEQAIEETFNQTNTILLGAFDKGCILGYLIVYHVLDECEIARIAVGEASRRSGVAGHLLLTLENICEENGIVNLFLEVREHNESAILFYKDKGFYEEGIRKNFYANPTEDGILMSRELGR